MMKCFIPLMVFVSFTVTSAIAQIQTAVITPNEVVAEKKMGGSVATFEKTEMDYGTIAQGSDGVRFFKFKNTGTEPLVIKTARSSCGCMVAKWTKEPILPSKTGIIEVKYDTNRPGTFSKSVFVETNEAQPQHILIVRGTVAEKSVAGASSNAGSKR